jgi:hypothetical protein
MPLRSIRCVHSSRSRARSSRSPARSRRRRSRTARRGRRCVDLGCQERSNRTRRSARDAPDGENAPVRDECPRAVADSGPKVWRLLRWDTTPVLTEELWVLGQQKPFNDRSAPRLPCLLGFSEPAPTPSRLRPWRSRGAMRGRAASAAHAQRPRPLRGRTGCRRCAEARASPLPWSGQAGRPSR